MPPSAAPSHCYHCGEPVPAGADYSLHINGESRPMCCPGCQAVAAMIAGSGMARFYEQRTAYSEKPISDDPADALDELAIYDDPRLQEEFCERDEDGLLQLRLLVGGVTCAACTWLIEQTLEQLPAVKAVSLNLGRQRLDVLLDDNALPVSRLMQAVARLGYRVQPWHEAGRQQQLRDEYRRDLRRLAVAGIGMMQVGMFAIALHAGDIQGISDEYRGLLRVVSLLVTTFIVWFSARGFFESAWRHLRVGALVMDTPVAIAIGLAWLASTAATITGSGEVYFDSVVMFTFLLLLARFIEKRVRVRDAASWDDAEALLPDVVQRWENGHWQSVPRRDVHAGDRILLRSGDTVAVDGIVRSGNSAVREDSFSGEVLPRAVTAGDTIFAGTVNLDASLELEATGSYETSRLAALQRSINSAQLDKPRLARLADRIAGRFIAAVLTLTAITAAIWWQIDPDRALWVSLSVLVISCPCALSLATPAALAGAATALRRRGALVHGETALEALPRTTHILFDKTGTLTTGAMALQEVRPLAGADEARITALSAALQRHASHPLARAFDALPAAPDVEAVLYESGRGLRAQYAGKELRLGSAAFCREVCPDLPDAPADALYWIALCHGDTALAWLGLSDQLRPEAEAVLRALADNGRFLELLTGDSSARAEALGRQLPFAAAHCGQSPQGKIDRVKTLQAGGAVVAMIGDGLNDAPVLKLADCSIAVTGANDLARAQADIVLLRGDLWQIAAVLATAQRTRRVILQNFAWALGYNALGIPLAALGLVPPWAAALGMSASSLLVVLNSLRLRNG